MANTPVRGLPYPTLADQWDTPGDLQALAEALDADIELLPPALAADRPPAGTRGRVFQASDTGAISLDIGTGWITFTTGGPYLALAGGAMGGAVDLADNQVVRPELRDISQTLATVPASGAARTLDLTVANDWLVTLDQACTISVTNPPAGARSGQFTLWLVEPGTLRAVTWPGSFRWPGAAPTLVASKMYVVIGVTKDAGATWQVSAQEYAAA